MQINLNKTAAQNLLDLIDLKNTGLSLDTTKVSVSAPSAYSDSNNPTLDTKVTLTGKGNSSGGYTGTVDVHYTRLSLAAEAASPSGSPNAVIGTLTGSQVLDAIVSYYGFLPGEVTANITPANAVGNQTITLSASGSLLYKDGTYNVTFNWTRGKTMLLMHMEDLTDAAGHTGITATGKAALTSTNSKFGSQCVNFNGGTGGTTGIRVPASNDFAFPANQDFTIEYFHFMSALTADYAVVNRNEVTAAATSRAWVEYNANQPQYRADNATGAFAVGGNAVFSTNVWQHIAWVRKNTTISLYVDGVLKGTLSAAASWGTVGGPLIIGSGGGTSMTGLMDELRISNVARYSAAFTPPSAPFALD